MDLIDSKDGFLICLVSYRSVKKQNVNSGFDYGKHALNGNWVSWVKKMCYNSRFIIKFTYFCLRTGKVWIYYLRKKKKKAWPIQKPFFPKNAIFSTFDNGGNPLCLHISLNY